MGCRPLTASGSWWLCAVAFFLPMSLTVADAQRPAGAAWLWRSLEQPGGSREARTDILCERHVRRRGERDLVSVVKDDEATEPKSAGK